MSTTQDAVDFLDSAAHFFEDLHRDGYTEDLKKCFHLVTARRLREIATLIKVQHDVLCDRKISVEIKRD